MPFDAAVMRAVRSPLTIERLDIRALASEEVLVRLHAAGVCHTDFEAWTGAFAAPLPTVLGHEAAGVVERVGDAVRGLAPGDHVVATIYPACGGCFYCHRSLPMLCESLPSSRPDRGGVPLRGTGDEPIASFLNVSAFAEYAVLPARGAIRIPSDVPFDAACLLGCAVITGVGAAMRIAMVQPGESVAVVGCGAVGLNVIQGAALSGAEVIVAVDRSAAKLARAIAFGATHAFTDDLPDLQDRIRALTAGRGVDHGFEAAGVVASLQTTLDCTRPGASVTILGKTAPDREVPLRFASLSAERRIRRSSLGGARAAEDFPMYAKAYLDGRLRLDEQIDLRLPLRDIDRAFDAIVEGSVVRTVIRMNE